MNDDTILDSSSLDFNDELMNYYFNSTTFPPHLEDYCPVAIASLEQVDWRGTLEPVLFRNTRAILLAHYLPHRYGNPATIELLWDKSKQDSKNNEKVAAEAQCSLIKMRLCSSGHASSKQKVQHDICCKISALV